MELKEKVDMAKVIDGKAVAQAVKDRSKTEVPIISKPIVILAQGLAVVLVGEDPASRTYVKNKIAACEAVGIESFHHKLPADSSQGTIEELVKKLNDDATVDGILVQLPLPSHLNSKAVLALIDPDKDVDGLTAVNQGRLTLGEEAISLHSAGRDGAAQYKNVELKGKMPLFNAPPGRQ
jgi:methylenetetrahydrofolate dehydrogenase (NADP+)/methenyltetrahydrofolate cyclohydrolase